MSADAMYRQLRTPRSDQRRPKDVKLCISFATPTLARGRGCMPIVRSFLSVANLYVPDPPKCIIGLICESERDHPAMIVTH